MNTPSSLRAYQQAFFLNNVQMINSLSTTAHKRWSVLDSNGWVRMVDEDQ
jgi:hypothetical protein